MPKCLAVVLIACLLDDWPQSVIRPNTSAITSSDGTSCDLASLVIGPITTVNSPLPPSFRLVASSDAVPRRNSWWTLVSSRPTIIGLLPKIGLAAFRVSAILWGASKNVMVDSVSDRARSHSFLSFDRDGGNPQIVNGTSGNPETTAAVKDALTPGIGSTGIRASTHALTSSTPGSEMPGVPASVTRAADFPFSSREIR